ncbi:PREDICTED: (E3-independent) E2 ubiquitin-conjugating enzyme-like [Acropora digitifera]|uniref:(E3-independent) E2 ubiquitin-conjugating enzyme-like n=1 Tax=Acropora digitifera TaxID=70779 RepID=UPI00077AB60D|nr:PREDICTED: (E3-independent) E2 ubiquitin-conjugating enzyme-like [Acropora digitifera]
MAEGGIYAEDIVKNSQGVVGLVLEDAEETSDDSDSEEEALKKGQIVVCWYPSGNEETLSTSKVKLADRSLLPGDVIKFFDVTRGTQKGFITNVEVVASVKVLLANHTFHNVDCKDLSPLQHFIPGAHVSMGPWLGIVTQVYRKVTLRVKNGARCCLEGEQSSMLYDISDQRDEVFAQISVIACDVDWQVCGACQQVCHGDNFLKPPDDTITQEQLPRLLVVNHFRHANLQIGDKAFYTLKACDLNHFSNNQWLIKQASDNDNSEGLSEMTERSEYTSPPSDSQTEGSGVRKVKKVKDNGNAETSKADRGEVTAADSAGNSLKSESSRESIALGNDSKGSSESIAEATSGKQKEARSTDGVEASGETNPADVHDNHHTAGSDSADGDDDSDGGETVTPKSKGGGSLKHDPGSSHSLRFPNKRRKKRLRRKRKTVPPLKINVGDKVCVEVTHTCTTVDIVWQDGSTAEKVLSTDLIPVFHLDELEFFPGDYVSDKRENADSSIYGVVLFADHKSRLCHIKWFSREGKELFEERGVSVYDIMEHSDFVFSAGDVVVRVVRDDSEYMEAVEGEAVERPTPCVGQVTLVDKEGSVFIKWVDKTVSKVKPQELYKIDAEVGISLCLCFLYIGFNGLLVDFYFKKEIITRMKNKYYKAIKVTQFHTTEEHNYLFSCSSFCLFGLQDILRVMITGPVDTPYEHGLFVFDVRLPQDYPASPPLFHYLSQCSGRLNPNLYEDGKVCVSLLGTWSGRGSEVWTSKSNVLQVLVSIQGLILCSEPYYNEAGYEKQRGTAEGRENSRMYSEMVLLKLVQSMERLLNKPPEGLQNEILQHFAHHGARLIQKLKRWVNFPPEQTAAVPSCEDKRASDNTAGQNQPQSDTNREDNSAQASNLEENRTTESEPEPRKELSTDDVANGDTERRAVGNKRPCEAPDKSPDVNSSDAQPQDTSREEAASNKDFPEYPLFPLSRGFCLSLTRALDSFRAALEKAHLPDCLE